jgi:hypothetical protein
MKRCTLLGQLLLFSIFLILLDISAFNIASNVVSQLVYVF